MAIKRVSDIIIGEKLPKYNDLWLDTQEGEENAALKYKGYTLLASGSGAYNFENLSNRPQINGDPMDGNTNISDFTGTDGVSNGSAGLVPAPTTSDADKFLKSDGTWAEAGGGGGTPSYSGHLGEVMMSDGNNSIEACDKFYYDSTNNKIHCDAHTLQCSENIEAGKNITAENSVTVTKGDVFTPQGDVYIGDKTTPRGIYLWDNAAQRYYITVNNSGQLVVTQS